MTSPKESYTVKTRSIRSLPDLDKPKLDAFIKEAKLRPESKKALEERIEKARKWIAADPKRRARFERAPIPTLLELFPELAESIPKAFLPGLGGELDGSACSQAPTGAYDTCVLELLQRVAAWLGQSAANREDFSRDPAAAIDVVAGRAPREAIAIAKVALDYAHRAR